MYKAIIKNLDRGKWLSFDANSRVAHTEEIINSLKNIYSVGMEYLICEHCNIVFCNPIGTNETLCPNGCSNDLVFTGGDSIEDVLNCISDAYDTCNFSFENVSDKILKIKL